MSFKKNKYHVIKSAISKDLAKVSYNYLLIKRNAIAYMRENNYLAPFDNNFGTWDDEQVPNTFSIYGDPLIETLLLYIKPKMIKATGLNLYQTYSYARTYKSGDILKKHKDRPSCEISTTLFLGGDKWPIYLNNGKKDIKINLKEGDMLIYKGCDLEHWREPFNGEVCVQTFLHYSTNEKLLNDTRPMLGLNSDFSSNMPR
jgi:hypothetical protein